MFYISGTWNFHEAGHGKGVPDGVGATIKRLADRLVLRGIDIPHAIAMYNALKDRTSVHLYHVSNESIDANATRLSQYQLRSVPGTMAIHQVICKNGQATISHRELSCLCKGNEVCDCFSPKEFTFPHFVSSQSVLTCAIAKDEKFFLSQLQKLQKCGSYDMLKLCAANISEDIKDHEIKASWSAMQSGMTVDRASANKLPDDLEEPGLIPVEVTPDGDCLPHTGSVLAFGSQDHPNEIRLRIILELILHGDLYLNPDYLRRGEENMTDQLANNLPNNFTMYSGQYEKVNKIKRADVIKTYQSEVTALTIPGSYMGIWEVFALSSILGAKIISVYPNMGNRVVRQDFNRTILPRMLHTTDAFSVMWTSTRFGEMRDEHFVPNLFVPLLKAIVLKENTPESYLNKHVIVKYDAQPYPGLVVDEDLEDLQVMCMHRIGQNRFFWPVRADICWYVKDDIVCVIPEPEKVTGRHMGQRSEECVLNVTHQQCDELTHDCICTLMKSTTSGDYI
jgi:hypothetical protein